MCGVAGDRISTQMVGQTSSSSSDEDILHGRLDTCSSTTTAFSEVSPRRNEIRRLAAPLSKEQLIDLVANAAAISPIVKNLVKATAKASPAARRIMVRNIHYATTDAAFAAHFAQFGGLDDAAIVREKTGQSKGFGFVTFKSIETMDSCLSSPLQLDGRKLYVKVAADPFSDFLSDGETHFPRLKKYIRRSGARANS